ncbi:MAG: BNR-4 repeat-containing protein, partial [Planctomycetota bacterium]
MREIPTSAAVYEAPVAEGYRGVWYSVRGGAGRGPEPWNVNKYGGAMATYPQQHAPIAIHMTDEAADNNAGIDRTYFVFGGFNGDPARTPNMIGYFDHTTGLLARPRTLLTRGTLDAHENPTLAIDTAGHLLVFSPSHGAERRSFITRSAEPWAIDRWQRVAELPGGDVGETFSYPQPHHVPGQGFLLLNTHYRPGGNRTLYLNRSVDGVEWEYDWAVGGANPRPKLAAMEHGQYQISWRFGNTIATAFNMHPKGSPGTPLDHRTNLYFAQTSDLGRTWTTAAGEVLGDLPLLEKHNPALVADYQRQGLNVYLKDVQQDASGRPVILFLTSGGSEAGPANGPRTLRTARFDGTAWIIRDVLQTDHNYDHGSLFIQPDGTWQLIGPFLPGAQPFGTGGNIGVWLSHDQG